MCHMNSLAKMYRPFKEQNDLQVSFSLHYSVYSRRFNLGFGRPATNVCSNAHSSGAGCKTEKSDGCSIHPAPQTSQAVTC